ncbi:MAG TPA: hypothetical protein VFF52_14555 [Isosphaeraceae bacterium]|nr:hypothetical protein [Isosphaeraceae bacterium]
MGRQVKQRSRRQSPDGGQHPARGPAIRARDDFVMERFGRLEEMDRSFDIE